MISLPNKVKGPALGEGGGESFTPSCTRACAPQAWLINYALSELLIKAVFKVYFAEGLFQYISTVFLSINILPKAYLLLS
ncbi:MAG TPA: hypothetical protein DCL81_12580 [Algoriphagus sp.]|nr:hypothetical protein [Algoriphagus sp.]